MIIFLFLLAGLVIGHRFMPRASIGTCIALGMGLAIWFSAIGHLIFFPELTLIGLGVTVIFFGFKWFATRGHLPRLPVHRLDRLVTFAGLIGGLLLAFGFFKGVGLPIINYDLLSYHIPIAWALQQRTSATGLFYEPQSFYAMLPLGGHLLQSWFTNEGLHSLGFQGLSALAALAGAFCCARIAAALGARVGVRAVVFCLYLVHPLTFSSIIAGHTDPIAALFFLAAVETVLLGRLRWVAYFIAGLLAGSAFSIKVGAIGVAVIPLLLLALLRPIQYDGLQRTVLRFPAAALLGVVVAMTPWLLRGMIVGGHPLFPFRGSSEFWLEEQGRFVVEVHRPIMLFSGAWFYDLVVRAKALNFLLPMTGISILLILSVYPLLTKTRRFLPVFAAAFAGYAFWLLVRDNPDRFLLPVVGLLIAAVPAFALGFTNGYRFAAASMIVVVAMVVAPIRAVIPFYMIPGVYVEYQREAVRDDILGVQFMQIVRSADHHDSEGRLMLLFEARPGFFQSPTVSNTVWDQFLWAPLLQEAPNSFAFENALIDSGITGIFVNEVEWGRLLSFYRRDVFAADFNPATRMGLMNGLPRDIVEKGLLEFPPARFSGLTLEDIRRLEEFLIRKRLETFFVLSLPSGQEIWFARLQRRELFRD